MKIPSAKSIIDLIKTGATIEAQEKIMELRLAAVEFQSELTEVQMLLGSKDKEIEGLQNKLAIKGSLVYEKPYYFLDDDDQGGKDGPFCQQCWDNENKLIRLQGGGTNPWNCNTCNSSVRDSNYKPPSISFSTIRR